MEKLKQLIFKLFNYKSYDQDLIDRASKVKDVYHAQHKGNNTNNKKRGLFR
jgi:hypothetical protein